MGFRCFSVLLVVLLGFTPGGLVASDGRIEINQAKALAGGVTPGDTAGFPVTLSVAASYVLTSDVDVRVVGAEAANTNAIEVAAAERGTSIDLNGFTIRGPAVCTDTPPCTGTGTGRGIALVAPFVEYPAVRNGSIIGMGSNGVEGRQVDAVIASSNGNDGILVAGGTVTNSSAHNNGGNGVIVNASTVRNVSAAFNLGDGIQLQNSTASGLTSLGNFYAEVSMSNSSLVGAQLTDDKDTEIRCDSDKCAIGMVSIMGCSGSDCLDADGSSAFVQLPPGSNYCGDQFCP